MASSYTPQSKRMSRDEIRALADMNDEVKEVSPDLQLDNLSPCSFLPTFGQSANDMTDHTT